MITEPPSPDGSPTSSGGVAVVADARPSAADRPLSAPGKAVRLLVTAVCGVLLLAGTALGNDDEFPFGPFRMYSTARAVDGVADSTRMEAVDADGRRFKLRDRLVGLRRAEIEGQMRRFREDPTRLGAVATAYRNRNPDAPPLVRIEIIVRRYTVRGGAPTGDHVDTVEVVWTPDGGRQ